MREFVSWSWSARLRLLYWLCLENRQRTTDVLFSFPQFGLQGHEGLLEKQNMAQDTILRSIPWESIFILWMWLGRVRSDSLENKG